MRKLSRVLVIIIFFLSHIPLYGQFVLSHEPGTYNSDVILEIIPEIEYENIFYRFPSYEESQWFNYEQPIVLSADKGSQRFYPLDLLFVNDRQIVDYRILEYTIDKKSPTQSFELTLYTADDVSNRSLPGIAQFDIDRRDEVIVDAIPIISPVEGDFANPQLLYIDDREFSQLRYTTDGSDPALDGAIYEEAVLLLAASYVKLRVYGETRDGRKLHKTIRYRAGNHEYRQLKQGRTTEDVYVVPIKAGLFYRTKDVHSAKLPFNTPVRFETEAGKLKTSLIRIIDGDREYRYFFVLDNRPPENPRANLLPPLPVYENAVDDENTMLSTVHAEPVHPPLNTENRIPKKPLLTGIPDTGVMSGNMFLLQIVDPLPNLEYFYSIGNSTVPPANPATSGKRAYSHIPIHIGSDIQSETIIIGLIAVLSTNKNYRSPVNYVRFQVDNRLPEEPEIHGVQAGSEYSESIAFSIDSGEGDTVFYQLSENGTKTNYMLYDAPKLLQGEEGKRVVYSLSAYSENTLGTRSNSVELGFAIDREAPEFPPMHISINNKEIDSQTLSIISSSAVTISFDTDDDVAYEFSRGSDPLPEIFPYSPLVHGYLTLDIPKNTEAQFNLRFRPIDFAGNFGPLSGEYTITIDKKIPDIPFPPTVMRDGNAGTLLWPPADDRSIEYSIADLNTDPANQLFTSFISSVNWEIPERSGGIVVYYRARDEAGLLSLVGSQEILREKVAPIPKITGVQDGGVYEDARNIQIFSIRDGDVRYEITSDGTEPDSVSPESRLWQPVIQTFDSAVGTKRIYRIKLRQYIPDSESQPSPELNFSFAIDREFPTQPRLNDMDLSDVYSMDPVTLDFSAKRDENIMLSVIEYIYDKGTLPENWGANFVSPVSSQKQAFQNFSNRRNLTGYSQELTLYSLAAYTIDLAGNRSRSISRWNVIIDRRNVFLSQKNDRKGIGSWTEPYVSINTAVDTAVREERSEIYIGSGMYQIQSTLNVPRSMQFYGSCDENWLCQSQTATEFRFTEQFNGEHLFYVTDAAEFSLDKIHINSVGSTVATLINLRRSRATLTDFSASVSGRIAAVSAMEKSTIDLRQSRLSGYALTNGNIINLNNSDIYLVGTQISAEDTDLSLLRRKNTHYVLLRGVNSYVEISQSTIRPRSGESTIAMNFSNSTLYLKDNSTIFSGYGKILANALVIENSSARFENIRINGSRETDIVSLLVSKGSDIILNSVNFNLDAEFGINGILLRGGSLEITNSIFQGVGAQDFVKAIIAQNGKLDVSTSQFPGPRARTVDYTPITAENSTVIFSNNVAELHSGNRQRLTLMELSIGSSAELSNNTLTSNGIVIRLEDPRDTLDIQ